MRAAAVDTPIDSRSLIGRQFGNVTIVRELGRGSMGAVFVGFQKSLKRQVAIKLLRKSVAASDRTRQQFRDEAETVAVLSHPYIVPIFEMGEDDDFFFQVMQLVDGEDLGRMIESRRRHPVPSKRLIPARRVVEIMTRVLEGLGYAHREDIVHQDIKPANIMVENGSGRPLIVDFGIARTARIEYWGEGMIVGSALYLAPEQAAGQPTDRRSDIYSTGLVLLEALAGRLPVREDEDERGIMVRKIRNPGSLLVRPPSECSPQINESMERIILKAISPYAEDRFSSCESFRSALMQWSPDEPVR